MKLRQITFALLVALGLSANAQNIIQRVTQATGAITLTEAVDYTITSTSPFATGASIDIQNPDATVVFENVRPSEVISRYLGKIKANGQQLTNNSNCRVSIYRHGAIVFAHSDNKNADGTDFYPVVMCSDNNCTNVIGSYNNTGRNTTGPWKDAARSFILKRGYMCTVANNADGTGYSHCYIANTADRQITLNKYLAGKLGFFRIFRWQWPGKLGMSDARDNQLINLTNASWFYDWEQATVFATMPNMFHSVTTRLGNQMVKVTRVLGKDSEQSTISTTPTHISSDRMNRTTHQVPERSIHTLPRFLITQERSMVIIHL